MKKQLLFVALYLQTGGVEKSLLSVLSSINYEMYDVDLCLFDHSGVLFESIPKEVNVLPPLFEYYSTPLIKSLPALLKARKFKLLAAKILTACMSRFSKGVGTGMRWSIYRHALPAIQKQYDVAISYLDFFCNYYVTEKVNANKKIVYNHMNYLDGQKGGWPCPRLDKKTFSLSDYVVSVAESARQSLVSFFPEITNKIRVIHNTVSSVSIKALAGEQSPIEFTGDLFKVLTVARLVEEKGVFLALEACKILIDKGYKLKWFFIGKGHLHDELTERIRVSGLNDHFILLGEKANPYPYMANCDIYIQPSKTEAHCVAVEEAMVLQRPIIVTDIPAFQDQIMNGETGIRVNADPIGIAQGIKQLIESPELSRRLRNNLAQADGRNNQELMKLFQLIDNDVAYSTN